MALPVLFQRFFCLPLIKMCIRDRDAVVIDVGINVDENGKLCGDVELDSISEQASMATPVPGGVGAVTTAVLAEHLVRAAIMQS